MIQLALSSLIIALIAAILGFGGIASVATDIAVVLFWVFGLLFLISLAAGLADRGLRDLNR